jgi:hypothetical protein
MSLNIINNTKAVADSYVNDQLKWRRERIEYLSELIKLKNEKIDNLETLYSNECKFVELMRDCIKEIVSTFEVEDQAASKQLMETINQHIENNNKFLNRKK